MNAFARKVVPDSDDTAPRANRRRRRTRYLAARPSSPTPPAPALLAAPADFERDVLPLADELFACALRYTRDAADADDLVQETLLRALGAWSRFIPGSNCRAWLLRILTNSFINNYRRRRRYRRFAHETGEDAVVALYGHDVERSANPSRDMLEHTLGDEVRAALDTLADDYRKVIELADLQGVRYRDIAESLGVPIGTVMSRLFRARRQLEELLRDYAANDYGISRAA